ncbi:ribonuclease P protein subunit p30 isoform X3 [Chiloscyllium plagiosum]|uniref:ribonuclease P protein subunit p30 isoform X3 n=1 Tax=Chiloscyllium plagiosum TaxID=36176 RepID=UPI001CB857D1|nr:ribonuclease P protein subunit p30 isoform X3 [Chiloscyllium plagiosum]
MAVFVDLNIVNTTDRKRLQSLIETAAHLGYSTVALNHVVELQGKRQEIAKPTSVSELFPSPPIVQGRSKPIKIVTRLTVIVSDASHCNDLRSTSPHTRSYDIVAVLPKTEKLFHVACMTLDVDLICINVVEKQPYHFRRPSVNGNIIMSSAAERSLELRGPYDIANLGLLFGLSEGDAKAAVSTNCRAALLHGETRKTALGVIYTVRKAPAVEEKDEERPLSKRAKTKSD